jgi:DNA-binding NarL/FixJ family response regulator
VRILAWPRQVTDEGVVASGVFFMNGGETPASGLEDEPAGPLTPRQIEILRLIAQGKTTGRIASELVLSGATVRNHVAATLRALRCHSRIEAVARARTMGLL